MSTARRLKLMAFVRPGACSPLPSGARKATTRRARRAAGGRRERRGPRAPAVPRTCGRRSPPRRCTYRGTSSSTRRARRCVCSGSTARAPNTCARPNDGPVRVRRIHRAEHDQRHDDLAHQHRAPAAERELLAGAHGSLCPDRLPGRASRITCSACTSRASTSSSICTGRRRATQRSRAVERQPAVRWPFADHAPASGTSVATQFKSDPMVLFDLFNEPILDANRSFGNGPVANPWGCWRNGCTRAKGAVAGMQQMLDARAQPARISSWSRAASTGGASSTAGSRTSRPTRWTT